MCETKGNDIDEENFDDDLVELFKKFKESNEREAGEPLDNKNLKVDFVNIITEKISKLVDNNFEK